MHVSVQFDWSVQGDVRLDENQKPVFPSLQTDPGLYRFRFIGTEGEKSYIGESDNLRRRMMHYRSPGPTQPTNIRLNQLMRAEIALHNRVELAIATNIALEVDGRSEHPDLKDQGTRRLVENAALVAARIDGTIVHNL